MKTKNLLLGGFSLCLMASCSHDESIESGGIIENETTTYVRVALVGDMTTRADGDYEYGSSDENTVNKILFTFFDSNYNYVGNSEILVNKDNILNDQVGTPDKPLGGTVERMLTVLASVNLPKNSHYPLYMVAYVNPTSKASDLTTDKLADVMTFIRDRSTISYSGSRTMNNSVYYDETSGSVTFATQVDFEKQFFRTREEAVEAKDATIEVTVERMEAKVRVKSPDETNSSSLDKIPVTPVTSNDETAYTLTFVPEAWFVNATEKRSFLLKNFRKEETNYFSGNAISSDFGLSYSDAKAKFEADRNFNDYNNKRSYWAIDPTYFYQVDNDGIIYPNVSYDVKYPLTLANLDNPNAREYPLLYRSYTDVLNEYDAHQSTNYVKYKDNTNKPEKSHEYVLENTMSRNTLASTGAMASMTSVVLLGHYVVKQGDHVVIDGASTNGKPNKDNTFYVYHGDESKVYVLINENESKNFFLSRNKDILYVQQRDNSGNIVPNKFEALTGAHLANGGYGVSYDDFELVYPSSDVAGITLSEQWRTISFSENPGKGKHNPNLYIYDATLNNNAGGYRNMRDTDTDIDYSLYANCGVVEKFEAAKAKFNVPLRHIWGTSNKFQPENVKLGDYGVVRNHIYDLTINKIEGLGTGIGDLDQPIVPPTDKEQYYISTKLKILQWRLVEQSVDL